jgi:hypothetical protein
VVLRRWRRWTAVLVLGLRVGLCASPHCVARSLNFFNVAIFLHVLLFFLFVWDCGYMLLKQIVFVMVLN